MINKKTQIMKQYVHTFESFRETTRGFNRAEEESLNPPPERDREAEDDYYYDKQELDLDDKLQEPKSVRSQYIDLKLFDVIHGYPIIVEDLVRLLHYKYSTLKSRVDIVVNENTTASKNMIIGVRLDSSTQENDPELIERFIEEVKFLSLPFIENNNKFGDVIFEETFQKGEDDSILIGLIHDYLKLPQKKEKDARSLIVRKEEFFELNDKYPK